jgi:hypothetical protein
MQSDPTTRQRFVPTDRCWQCARPLEGRQQCTRCGARSGTPWNRAQPHECRCARCGRLLLVLHATDGYAEAKCIKCKTPNVFHAQPGNWNGVAAAALERVADPASAASVQMHAPPSDLAELVAVMETRWRAFTAERSRRRAEVAVGLRFDVFKRDGFRCRYCGVSVDQGALLHVDHVVARSRGGADTLDNLVTACVECNLGKSDKTL